jgi:hypothetical protein
LSLSKATLKRNKKGISKVELRKQRKEKFLKGLQNSLLLLILTGIQQSIQAVEATGSSDANVKADVTDALTSWGNLRYIQFNWLYQIINLFV